MFSLDLEVLLMGEIIVGSRSSKLAMIQTERVINALKKQGVTQPIKIKDVMTEGDQNLQAPLARLGRGVFLEELEEQLLDGSIDMAVHSLKDVPVSMPEGLMIACIPEREDHRDAYIANGDIGLHNLQAGAVIGTSSLRRAAQLLAKRPDLQTKWIRGPIDSRIEQLHNGDFDAIILAVAGMKRLGIDEDLITEYLPDDHFVPAMGQGALAIECRTEDEAMREILAMIHDEEAAQAVRTERLFLQAFDEGEQAPIGGYAFVSDGMIHLRGMVISLNGQTVLKYEASGERPEAAAQEVADVLIDQGAMKIIAEAKQGM